MKTSSATAPTPRAKAIQHGRSPLLMTFVGFSLGLLAATLIIPARQGIETVRVEALPDGTSTDMLDEGGTMSPGASPAPTPSDEGLAATGGMGHDPMEQVEAPVVAGPSATGPSPRPTASTSGPAGPAGPAPPVQGVTDSEIHVGVGIPDLGALAAMGPNYDFGDPREHIEALLARWREEGRLPVHGRDIVPHYRRYDIVGTEQQRAACKGWALDDEVFAVWAVQQFWAAAPCVTAEHGLPLITSMSYYDETYAGAGDLIIDLQMSTERVLRNFANWAHDSGHLAGRTIGIYYATGTDGRPIREAFIPRMHELGYAFEVEVTTDNFAYGSPTDNVAAQQFAAAGVDLALLFVSGINQTNFMQQAESQLYRPSYLVTDIISSTNDTATSTYPTQQYDGTFGLTNLRYGEEAAGLPKNPHAKSCEDNYLARGGTHVQYRQNPAEWLMLMAGCDEGEVLLQALERVGRDLNLERLLDELYRTTDLELALHSPVTLRRGGHGGTSAMRALQWHADCRCFHAISDFQTTYGQ